MRFVLLTSKPDSPYADTATSYEYPAQYRKYFVPLERGEPMIAILYEPGDHGRGRMAYVGWAPIAGAPILSPRKNQQGQRLWEVRYLSRVEEFDLPVPLRYLGQPIERWLREAPSPGQAMRGKSVRWMDEGEAALIMELGRTSPLRTLPDLPSLEIKSDTSVLEERTRRVVESLVRDARFRRDVMRAYEFTCAMTGLSIGSIPEGRATRLLDAAHIRPVSDQGEDATSNGLALTPTVHRLFDEGLVSLRWSGDALVIARSPRLEPAMIESPERGTMIRLETGLPLILPTNRDHWPSPDRIRFHQRHVFKGPDSLVS